MMSKIFGILAVILAVANALPTYDVVPGDDVVPGADEAFSGLSQLGEVLAQESTLKCDCCGKKIEADPKFGCPMCRCAALKPAFKRAKMVEYDGAAMPAKVAVSMKTMAKAAAETHAAAETEDADTEAEEKAEAAIDAAVAQASISKAFGSGATPKAHHNSVEWLPEAVVPWLVPKPQPAPAGFASAKAHKEIMKLKAELKHVTEHPRAAGLKKAVSKIKTLAATGSAKSAMISLIGEEEFNEQEEVEMEATPETDAIVEAARKSAAAADDAMKAYATAIHKVPKGVLPGF